MDYLCYFVLIIPFLSYPGVVPYERDTTTKYCSIGREKASSTQAVLYCTTSLSWLCLCVDVIVLNFIELVMFVC